MLAPALAPLDLGGDHPGPFVPCPDLGMQLDELGAGVVTGMGHTGFVERVEGGYLHTIEGNTDASQTREGGGVYRLTRKVGSINKGFIGYVG